MARPYAPVFDLSHTVDGWDREQPSRFVDQEQIYGRKTDGHTCNTGGAQPYTQVLPGAVEVSQILKNE